MSSARLKWVAIFAFFLGGCPGFQEKPETPSETTSEKPVDEAVWPTEEQAKAIMVSVENLVRASKSNQEIYHIKLVRHDVHSFQFADEPIEKWMEAAQVSIAFPARVQYTRIEEYTDLPDKSKRFQERGGSIKTRLARGPESSARTERDSASLDEGDAENATAGARRHEDSSNDAGLRFGESWRTS